MAALVPQPKPQSVQYTTTYLDSIPFLGRPTYDLEKVQTTCAHLSEKITTLNADLDVLNKAYLKNGALRQSNRDWNNLFGMFGAKVTLSDYYKAAKPLTDRYFYLGPKINYLRSFLVGAVTAPALKAQCRALLREINRLDERYLTLSGILEYGNFEVAQGSILINSITALFRKCLLDTPFGINEYLTNSEYKGKILGWASYAFTVSYFALPILFDTEVDGLATKLGIGYAGLFFLVKRYF